MLGGLSPRENREVPPLRYDVVRAVKERFPALPVILNGGLRQTDTVLAALSWFSAMNSLRPGQLSAASGVWTANEDYFLEKVARRQKR